MLNAVSFTKGCYVGQEDCRAHPHPGTCELEVGWVGLRSCATAPSRLEKLLAGGKEIGEVTSGLPLPAPRQKPLP